MTLLRAALAALAAGVASSKKYNTAGGPLHTPGVIDVHLVSHTHDDVGWLKTVDQYYYGSHQQSQHAGVQYILDSVVASLQRDPNRKFTYVEQAFFMRWWAEQDDAVKATVRGLVSSGQLVFANGGWSMHDEANTLFSDMIDNTALGQRLIAQEFGEAALPRVTVQHDPFGHSAFQASMLSTPLAGFVGTFFGRIDYSDMRQRRTNVSMEMLWAASASMPDAVTWASINDNLYFPPNVVPSSPSGGVCWDAVNCNDDAVMDDPSLEDYNVNTLVDAVVAYARKQASQYAGAIKWDMGFDFNYEYAEEWYKNLDKLIHYVNLNTTQHGVNLFYSTFTQYAEDKLSYPITWPQKVVDDFFPYLDGPHSSWAGYFTSRPALKGYVRDSGSLFQAAKQLQALAGSAPPDGAGAGNALGALERAVGVTQHHDAVAGTAQQHVTHDYARRLHAGRRAAEPVIAAALAALTRTAASGGAPFALCDLANVTICPSLEAGQPTLVALYNSQGQAKPAAPVLLAVGLPAGVATYAVADAAGAPVTAQTLPLSPADAVLRREYYNASAGAPLVWLAFQATLPPAGFAVYFLVPVAAAIDAPATHASVVVEMPTGSGGGGLRGGAASAPADANITNGLVTLTLSGATGLLAAYANPAAGVASTPLTQQFLWYNASTGDALDGQASGAYIFRPVTGSSAQPLSASPPSVTLLTGPVLSEARQTVAVADVGALVGATWARQAIRLWAGDAGGAELEWVVGPVPFGDGAGREIISRISAPTLASAGAFATDSNGRDMMARARNHRKYFNYTDSEPIAANYYPVNSAIELTDAFSGLTLSVVTDRSQGGSSLADGSLELMLHRRLQRDDNRGVSEPLNETGLDGNGLLVKGTHRLALHPRAGAAAWRRAAAQDVALFRPVLAVAPFSGTPAAWLAAGHVANWTGLSGALPPNVHLLTVAAWGAGTMLLRLAHMFGAGEDAVLSRNATVALAGLFPSLPLAGGCTEMTLPGAQPLGSVAARLPPALARGQLDALLAAPPRGSELLVDLAPMQVRTFLCAAAAAAAAAEEVK